MCITVARPLVVSSTHGLQRHVCANLHKSSDNNLNGSFIVYSPAVLNEVVVVSQGDIVYKMRIVKYYIKYRQGCGSGHAKESSPGQGRNRRLLMSEEVKRSVWCFAKAFAFAPFSYSLFSCLYWTLFSLWLAQEDSFEPLEDIWMFLQWQVQWASGETQSLELLWTFLDKKWDFQYISAS